MANVLTMGRVRISSGTTEGEAWEHVVTFDSINATAEEAREAVEIAEGEKYPGKNWYAKLTATQREIDEANTWDVTVDWQPAQGGKPEDTESEPIWNINVKFSPERIERPADGNFAVTSIDGDSDLTYGIANSARTPYDPIPTYADADACVDVSYNTDNGSRIKDIEDRVWHVNSDEITITWRGYTRTYAAGKLRLIDYSAEIDKDYGVDDTENVWKVSFKLARRIIDEHHDIELEDSGYVDIDGKVFVDAVGQPRSEPTRLDGEGHELTTGISTPRKFNMRPRVAFAPLVAGL